MPEFEKYDCVTLEYAFLNYKGRVCHKQGSKYCVVFKRGGGLSCKLLRRTQHKLEKVDCTCEHPTKTDCDTKCDGNCDRTDL